MMKRFSKQVLLTLLAIVVAVYLFVQIFLSISVSYEVENVYMTSYESKKSLDAYIFRDETPIYADAAGGTSCYLVKDGEKVHKGQTVATAYKNKDDALRQEEINVIDEKLETLSKSGAASLYTSNDLGRIENSITSSMTEVIKCIKDKCISLSSEAITNITVMLNSKQAVMTGKKNIDDAISSLETKKAELASLLSGKGSDVKSPMSGYFYSAADGFETYFTGKALEELSFESYEQLKEATPDTAVLNGSVGKIAASSKWYLVCTMTKRQSSELREGYKYEFTFPNSFGTRINMIFERKITRSDLDTVIMVFSSNTLKDEFDFSRKQTAEFVFDVYEGLKVPTEAVRYIDGRNGVYALEGSKVVFKEIKVKSVQSGYCIVYLPDDYTTEEEKLVAQRIKDATALGLSIRDEDSVLLPQYQSHQKLDLYDAVITGGKDLEEGMMLR